MSLQHEAKNQVKSAVGEFVRSLASSHERVADMGAVVEATSRISLSNLDDWERWIRSELYLALAGARPVMWKPRARPVPFLTWMDLCSGDGFRRERTLRASTGAAPNRFFLALAVRRLNDWVPQVRVAAAERLPSLARESDPEDVADVLCAVLPHWQSWRRMDGTGRESLLEIMSGEVLARALESRLISAAAGPWASVLAQAGQAPALDAALREIARKAVQPAVRARAYRCLLDGKMVWPAGRKWEWSDIRYCKGHFRPVLCERRLTVEIRFDETLRSAALDRSPMVRRAAGDVLVRAWADIGPVALEVARLLASDAYPSVVERGAFALRKLRQRVPEA